MLKAVQVVAAIAVINGSGLVAIADDAPSPASTACTVGEPRNESGLSADKLAISGALFTALCTRSGGMLVNGDDSRLAGRFVRPTFPSVVTAVSSYPLQEPPGKVILAFIVETDGLVSWVSVLEPSGSKDLDAAAFWFVKKLKCKSPAKLDGNAVRVYLTTVYGSP